MGGGVGWSLTPLQRSSKFFLQSQPTSQEYKREKNVHANINKSKKKPQKK